MELLIKNVTAVTMDPENPVVENCFIGIDQGKICWLSEKEPEEKAGRVVDGQGCAAMPGLVNAHTHLPMTLLRGYADDYALQEWLQDHIFPAEGRLDARCVQAGMMLGLAESIRFGTTSVTEMYFKMPTMAEVCFQAGIKANLCNGAMCFDPASYNFHKAGETLEMEEMLKSWHMADEGRIRLDVGIHGEYTSCPAVWEQNAAYAQKHGLNIHLHLSETKKEQEECIARWGKTPARVLADHGVFESRVTAAHGVWITEEDMDLLAEKKATVAHNPVSNLKLASGVAPAARMAEKGVNVALGTDGVASNNSHDLFEEIKLSALLQKGIQGDPRLVPAQQALSWATRGGAFAQGREKECGMLQKGMDADLILVDLSGVATQPVHSPVSALCYSATGREVVLTMVRGRILYEKGEFKTIDVERAMAEMKNYALPRMTGRQV